MLIGRTAADHLLRRGRWWSEAGADDADFEQSPTAHTIDTMGRIHDW